MAASQGKTACSDLLSEGVPGAEIHRRLSAQYGENVLPQQSIYEWIEKLKNDQTSMKNLVAVLKPEDDWGQRDPEIRKLRNTMNPRLETRLYRRSYKCRHKCLTRSVYLKKVIAEEEKWYNVYLEKEDSIGTKSEESESSEEEENEDMMGEAAAAYSLYSELSSVTLKSATDVARVTFVRSDPAAGTSSGNK